MSNERIIVWDLLKLFAIFLVVWGHCMQHLLQLPTNENSVFLWISSFHMPLFMCLAGLFAERTFKRPFKDYMLKRSRQLLLPWISWSLILLFVAFLLGEKMGAKDIGGLLFNALWFLKSLFVCGLLALIGFKPKGNRILWVVISVLLSQIVIVWNVFTMYPCFLLGILCAKKMKWLKQYSKIIAIVSGIIFLVMSIIAANSPSFWMRDLGIRAMLFNGNMSISKSSHLLVSIALVRYTQVFMGCMGAVFFMTLFRCLFSNNKDILANKIARFGQFTLGIYVIQTLLVETIMPYLYSVDLQYSSVFNWIIAPCISVSIVYISAYINMLIENRGGYLPLILFGKMIK